MEALPKGEDLATKADLKAVEANLLRWMLTFFASLWVGFAATIVTIVVAG